MRSSVVLVSLLASVPLVLSQATGFDPSKIPTSCLQTKCQDYVNAVTKNGCADISCLCTNTVASTLQTCLQCVVSANVAGFDQTALNNAINSFSQGCSAAGHPVTISGVSGGSGTSGSGSGSSGTQTAAGAGSTATTPATTGGSGGATTKTSGAAGNSLHIGGLVAGAALAGVVLL